MKRAASLPPFCRSTRASTRRERVEEDRREREAKRAVHLMSSPLLKLYPSFYQVDTFTNTSAWTQLLLVKAGTTICLCLPPLNLCLIASSVCHRSSAFAHPIICCGERIVAAEALTR